MSKALDELAGEIIKRSIAVGDIDTAVDLAIMRKISQESKNIKEQNDKDKE